MWLMQSMPSDRSPSRGRSVHQFPSFPTLHHQLVLAHVAGEVSLQRAAIALDLFHHRQICISSSLFNPTLEADRTHAREGMTADGHALKSRKVNEMELPTVLEAIRPRVAAADPQRLQRRQLLQLASLIGGEAAGTDVDLLQLRTVGDTERGVTKRVGRV